MSRREVYFAKIRKPKSKRIEIKRRLVDFLGGKCVDCGFSGHLAALDFDHKEPSKKEFALARNMDTKDYLVLLEEARKCVLRCANCHRIKTHPNATDKR